MTDKLTKLDPDQADEIFADVDVEVPETLPKPPAGTKITVGEASKLAKKAGLVGVDARKMSGLAEFGKYLEELGVEKIGGVYLAFSGEQIRAALERIDLISDDAPTDPELQMRGQELKKELVKLLIETGKTMLKAGESRPPRPHDGLSQYPPFPANTPVMPQMPVKVEGDLHIHQTTAK